MPFGRRRRHRSFTPVFKTAKPALLHPLAALPGIFKALLLVVLGSLGFPFSK